MGNHQDNKDGIRVYAASYNQRFCLKHPSRTTSLLKHETPNFATPSNSMQPPIYGFALACCGVYIAELRPSLSGNLYCEVMYILT